MPRRRYYRKRKKRPDDFWAPFVGVLFLAVLFSALDFGGQSFGFDIGTWARTILVGLVVMLVLLFIFILFRKTLRKFIARFKRRTLYKHYKSISELLALHPQQFEEFVASLYEHQGYRVEAVTAYSGDHGIDVVVSKDGKRYAIQAKRYHHSNHVGAAEVREFYGSYVGGDFHGGIFVTTSSFSKQAQAWAVDRGMELIDGTKLTTMLRPYEP